MNILDNVKGSYIRGMRVYCGPSLGWVDAPIFQDTLVTGNHTVQPYESILLCNFTAPSTITLPLLSTWLKNVYGSWPIYLKDVGANFATNNCTLLAQGGDSIDGLGGLSIVSDRASVLIRPRSDLLGWYTT